MKKILLFPWEKSKYWDGYNLWLTDRSIIIAQYYSNIKEGVIFSNAGMHAIRNKYSSLEEFTKDIERLLPEYEIIDEKLMILL